jgi:hypothetical protein
MCSSEGWQCRHIYIIGSWYNNQKAELCSRLKSSVFQPSHIHGGAHSKLNKRHKVVPVAASGSVGIFICEIAMFEVVYGFNYVPYKFENERLAEQELGLTARSRKFN